MKRLPISCLILFTFSKSLFGQPTEQTEVKKLVVYSITEYIDGFVIKAIDKSKLDTINIISIKEEFTDVEGYEKIKINGMYNFKIYDLFLHIMPPSPNPIPLSIKTTLIWHDGDRVQDIPVYARNMKGLYIKEE